MANRGWAAGRAVARRLTLGFHRPWPVRRALHLLTALALIGGFLLTQLTSARFGPPSLVLRDTAGCSAGS